MEDINGGLHPAVDGQSLDEEMKMKMQYIGFVGVLFFCLIGCFSMIVWTPTVFECLICMRFLFLYLHLFRAIENVSHGKAL